MALTRLKDARTGKDGPVSGALIVMPVAFTGALTNRTFNYSWSPPAGQKLEIVAIDVRATNVSDAPSLTIGTAIGGAQIAAAITVTATFGALTLVSTEVTAGDVLDVQIVNNTTAEFDSTSVTITGYVSAPPDSLAVRHAGHF